MTDKYLEAEKRLAELKGWTEVRNAANDPSRLVGVWPNGRTARLLKRWTRDWNACGPLMVEHGVFSWLKRGIETKGIVVRNGVGTIHIKVPYADHPDPDTAVRYAIVMAVIAKLEQEGKQ